MEEVHIDPTTSVKYPYHPRVEINVNAGDSKPNLVPVEKRPSVRWIFFWQLFLPIILAGQLAVSIAFLSVSISNRGEYPFLWRFISDDFALRLSDSSYRAARAARTRRQVSIGGVADRTLCAE